MTAKEAAGKRLADRLISLRGWRLFGVFLVGRVGGGGAASSPSSACSVCFVCRVGMAAGRYTDAACGVLRRMAVWHRLFCCRALLGVERLAGGCRALRMVNSVRAARLVAGSWPFHRLNGMGSPFLWRAGISRVLVLAATWAMSEGLRGAIFTGISMEPYRQCLGVVCTCSAGAAWTGVYGLSNGYRFCGRCAGGAVAEFPS